MTNSTVMSSINEAIEVLKDSHNRTDEIIKLKIFNTSKGEYAHYAVDKEDGQLVLLADSLGLGIVFKNVARFEKVEELNAYIVDLEAQYRSTFQKV
ncbi:MAG: hypothetical protein O2809_06230 [Proteobacteria bacterium]|nr:hypothetical protein [Pseudomonadota bacterium]